MDTVASHARTGAPPASLNATARGVEVTEAGRHAGGEISPARLSRTLRATPRTPVCTTAKIGVAKLFLFAVLKDQK